MLLMIFKIIKNFFSTIFTILSINFYKSRIGWKRAKVYSDYLKDCQSKIKFDDVCSEHTIDKVKELKKWFYILFFKIIKKYCQINF